MRTLRATKPTAAMRADRISLDPIVTEESRGVSRVRGGKWLAIVGVTVAGLSVAGIGALESRDQAPNRQAAPTVPMPAQTAAALAVTVQQMTYGPGQSSGWHAHPGIHSVVVLSGTLTVSDAACGSHTFGPGETYVGGQQTHLARNESAEPVEMMVVYSTTVVPSAEYTIPALAPERCADQERAGGQAPFSGP